MVNPPAEPRDCAALPGINWWCLIVDMERCGYTHAAMGAAVGVSRSTVESWKNRFNEPAHIDGERLCALWRVVTGGKREDLPRKSGEVLSAAEFR